MFRVSSRARERAISEQLPLAMEPWQYTDLEFHFSSVQERLLCTRQNSNLNTTNYPRRPVALASNEMDQASLNNSTTVYSGHQCGLESVDNDKTLTGIKRKAGEPIHFQPKKQENRKVLRMDFMMLDTYTQTETTALPEPPNRLLLKLVDFGMENQRRIENLERLLESVNDKLNIIMDRSTLTSSKPLLQGPKTASPRFTMTISKPESVTANTCQRTPSLNNLPSPPAGTTVPTTSVPFMHSAIAEKTPENISSSRVNENASQPSIDGAHSSNWPIITAAPTPAADGHNVVLPSWGSTIYGSPTQVNSPFQGSSTGSEWSISSSPLWDKPPALKKAVSDVDNELKRDTGNSHVIRARIWTPESSTPASKCDEKVVLPQKQAEVPVVTYAGKTLNASMKDENENHVREDPAQDVGQILPSPGCWLGSRNDPHNRVWFSGDPKIIQRAEVSGTNPTKLALNLLEALFTRNELAASNVNGSRGRDLLDPVKIQAVKAHVNSKFSLDAKKMELRWQFIRPKLDSKCRAQRRLQKLHQARQERANFLTTWPERLHMKVAIDPKEKEELLYGRGHFSPADETMDSPQAVLNDGQEFTGNDPKITSQGDGEKRLFIQVEAQAVIVAEIVDETINKIDEAQVS